MLDAASHPDFIPFGTKEDLALIEALCDEHVPAHERTYRTTGSDLLIMLYPMHARRLDGELHLACDHNDGIRRDVSHHPLYVSCARFWLRCRLAALRKEAHRAREVTQRAA